MPYTSIDLIWKNWSQGIDFHLLISNLRLITLFGLKGNLWRKIIAISDFAFPFCALLAFNGKIGNWALKRESPFLRGIQQIFTRWKKKKRRRKRLKIWVVLSSIRRRGSRSKECRLSPSSSARELAPHMPWMGPHLRIFGGFHVPSSSYIAHWGKKQHFIQKFPRIRCLKNVNFVKNETLKMWFLWKMRFWKCEFCLKWDFGKCDFLCKLRIFAPVCKIRLQNIFCQ